MSDSVVLAGSPPGRYGTPVGGEVELRADVRLNVAGTPYMAGAALPLRRALVTLCRVGFAMSDIVRLVAGTPLAYPGAPNR